MLAGPGERRVEPAPVPRRRVVHQDGRAGRAPRAVVEARADAAQEGITRRGLGQHAVDHALVVEEVVLAVGLGQQAQRHQQPRFPAGEVPPAQAPPVGRELDRQVQPDLARIGAGAAAAPFELGQRQLADALLARDAAPGLERAARIGQVVDLVDDEQRLAVDADVARVAEVRQQRADVGLVVLVGVALLHQHLALAAVPGAAPVLVGPGQAVGEVRLAAGADLLDRALQQPVAVEPVVVVAEAADAVLPRQRRLRGARLGQAQVVEAELARQVRLVMALVERPRLGDVAPLGEALAPPGVVLRDRVELRQHDGDRQRLVGRGRGHRSGVHRGAGTGGISATSGFRGIGGGWHGSGDGRLRRGEDIRGHAAHRTAGACSASRHWAAMARVE